MSAKEAPHFRDFTCKANKKEKYISFAADANLRIYVAIQEEGINNPQ